MYTPQATAVATASQSSREPSVSDTASADTTCPECDSATISSSEEGTRYCQECGLVLSQHPLERSEPGWKPREQRRMGPATSVSHESVGTTLWGNSTDRTWVLEHHNNRLEYSTRALKAGLREVRDLCTACELSKPTEEHAAYLYRRASQADLLKGRSRESIAGACVYTAARRYGQPVTIADVAAASPVSEQRISSDYRTLLQELGIGLRPPEPREFLPKIATDVGVPFRVQRRGRELLEEATQAGKHIGQSPSGIAAAAVYAAAEENNEPLTQEAVAEAAGVSTVTISRQYQCFQAGESS